MPSWVPWACDVEQHLPTATWGHLPASLGRAYHDRLVASGVLGGDTVWLLKRVPEEVATSALPQALCTSLRQHTFATLASFATSLGPTVPTLPP
jgi:hypothetical protein